MDKKGYYFLAPFITPEVLIGFHPDAAASFYLSRLPGHLGEYLALTGEKLNGVEMVSCGFATYYSLLARLPLIEEQIGRLVTNDPTVIETTLEQYGDLVYPDNNSVLQRLEVVDKCFCHDTVEEIVDAVEVVASETKEPWCISTLNILKEASPLSLKVSLRSIREGRFQNLDKCLLLRYHLKPMMKHEFKFRKLIKSEPSTASSGTSLSHLRSMLPWSSTSLFRNFCIINHVKCVASLSSFCSEND